MVVALNMMDIVKQRHIKIKTESLEELLGYPVVPIIANKNKGIDDLKITISKAVTAKEVSSAIIEYPGDMEKAIERLIPIVEEDAVREKIDPRWLAVKLLEDDEMAVSIVGTKVGSVLAEAKKRVEANLGDEADILVADGRYAFINGIYREALQRTLEVRRTVSDAIDTLLLNRVFGIPFFLLAMYLTFMITINVGGCFIDFFDIFFGTVFVDGFGGLLGSLHFPDWLITFLAGGIGGGIQTMATFIPPIGFMFLCLSTLEDSGYMARAAFVMDRFIRYIGLPGKSFIPMLVGFGCNVPAIMATRTLENERDRTLTIMMNPFMSCGARLPVYALFAAAFFPRSGSILVFGLYLTGIALAMMTGFILKSTVLKGEASHFIMELPPYHIPTVRGVFIHTYDRLKQFMFRAGRILLPIFIILAFLNSMGTDGSFGHEDSNSSVLSAAGRAITPIFQPMGLTQENWPATVGIFTGIFAKEAVVGTLNALYSTMGEPEGGEEEGFSFWGGIEDAFVSIPAALSELGGTFTDPLGIGIDDDLTNLDAVAEDQEVSKSTFGAMVKSFDGRIGAIAYLLFVLIYYPCLAAIAAIYRETNLKWTIFAATYLTLLAWTVATLFYQLGTFGRHPGASLMWVAILVAAFSVFIYGLRKASGKVSGESPESAVFQHA